MTGVLVDAVFAASPYVCLAMAFGLLYGMLGQMDLTVAVRFSAAAYGGWCGSLVLDRYPAFNPVVITAAFISAGIISAIAWFLHRPLARGGPLIGLIGSLGITQVIQAAFQFGFGAAPRVYSGYPVESGIPLLGTTATKLQIVSLIYAVTAVTTTAVALVFTSWGRSLKVIAADPEVAESVFGISRSRIELITTSVAAAVLTPAAILYSSGHGVAPTTGADMSLLAFVGAVVAGRGRPVGAVIVTVGLIVLRSVAIRLPWSETSIAVVAAAAAFTFAPRWISARWVTVGTTAVAVTAAAVGSWLTVVVGGKNLGQVVPSDFQGLCPYAVALFYLLAKPNGVFVVKTGRRV